MNIAWLTQPVGPGGGGHTTISRFVKYLQEQGHNVSFYLYHVNTINQSAKEAQDIFKRSYGIDVEVRELAEFKNQDVVFATSWDTAYAAFNLKEKNLHIACVTNKPSIFTEPLLAKNGLYPYFQLIYCSDTFLVKKPSPFPMQMACKKFGCRPEQAVAIGDSVNDAQAARAAGCCLFMVPYGYNYGRPVEEMNPDATVSSLLEAANLVS